MDAIKTGHERPVNRQARMILAKSPWWALPRPEKQEEIVRSVESFDIEQLVNVTRQPPFTVHDHRGMTIGDVTVIGFADTKTHWVRKTTPPPWWIGHWDKRRTREVDPEHFWWVVRDGEVERMSWFKIRMRDKTVLKLQNDPSQWTPEQRARYKACKTEEEKDVCRAVINRENGIDDATRAS